MLLNEPLRDRDARSANGRGALGDADAGPSESAAWVMVGGLDRALLQAGIIGRLLEGGAQPVTLIASGVALANAVLVASARRDEFERRWEQLRAHRFLASAALGNVRLLGALNGMFDELSAQLAEIVQAKAARADGGPVILAATEEGFSPLPHDCTTSNWRAAVKRSLRYSSESAPLIAGAIREGASRASRVLVLGLERTMQSHPDVDSACRAAAADGVKTMFVTTAAPRRAGLLDYLLPGSGAPERLMREGRSAADRWMLGAGRNGSGRPGQVPLGESGGIGGGPFSEPDGDDGLWTSDASDASNWLK
ncbi:MAG TPA: hypothetical protein VFO62_00905 [Candidatus Binatia bacterium]|nr:hypothetical protein [Candidatus Binatia bacterium]